jgi:hypothetical protein
MRRLHWWTAVEAVEALVDGCSMHWWTALGTPRRVQGVAADTRVAYGGRVVAGRGLWLQI